MAALTLGLAPVAVPAAAARGPVLKKVIPATSEQVPAIGMGSWITFDVGKDAQRRNRRLKVLRTFFEMGGGMVDSSPMYGSSQAVIGYCLARIADKRSLFSATKVWTFLQSGGVDQMDESKRLWGVKQFDLMQIHNLLSWEDHLETLVAHKAAGRIRYIGVSTSHGRRHDAMEEIMAEQPLDFTQFTYNILDRRAERRLLPLAAERGLAVIARHLDGVAYLEAYTRADEIDGDMDGFLQRTPKAYRRLFQQAGLLSVGLQCYVNDETGPILMALEAPVNGAKR